MQASNLKQVEAFESNLQIFRRGTAHSWQCSMTSIFGVISCHTVSFKSIDHAVITRLELLRCHTVSTVQETQVTQQKTMFLPLAVFSLSFSFSSFFLRVRNYSVQERQASESRQASEV